MRFHAESRVTLREVDAAGGETQTTNRRDDLLKFAGTSGLLLTFGGNWIRRNCSAASTRPAATTRSAAATLSTPARSAAATLSTPATSSGTSARTTACIAAAA
jgi:hypothetical protein